MDMWIHKLREAFSNLIDFTLQPYILVASDVLRPTMTPLPFYNMRELIKMLWFDAD